MVKPRHLAAAACLAATGTLLSPSPISATDPVATTPDAAPVGAAPAAVRALRVRTVVDGLDHPWDLAFIPNGSMMFTQRERGTVRLRNPRGQLRTVVADVPGLWVNGETGLMAIAVDPRFRRNKRFYLCHGFQRGNYRDVRVTAWRANRSVTRARQVKTLVGGIPATSGRHGGCRLRFGDGGALFVGTGDAARTGTSRSLRSQGGKVLRINARTGAGVRSNPFADSPRPRTRKIFTYGHRNVQGLTQRPGGRMWSVEHGTFRDDEINRLVSGGDYGWQAGPGYDESPPMTDHDLPGRQIDARWSSGNPTVATSGATWLSHRRWSNWRGRLAVAALKDRSVRIVRFDGRGRVVDVAKPARLDGDFGRLRTAQLGPDGRLYLTTDNGDGNDRILVVTPR